MDVPPRELRKENIASDHDFFGGGRNPTQTKPRRDNPLVHHSTRRECRVLAVIRYRNLEGSGVLEGGAHQMTGSHRATVVTHCHGTRRYELTELG